MSNIDKRASQVGRYDLVSGYMQKWPDGEFVYHSDYRALLDELEAAEKRIAELQAREGVVNIKPPVIGRAYSALNRVWTEQEVRKACELAGIKLSIAAAGKGE